MANETSDRRNLTALALGLVAGIAIFHREWYTLLTPQLFYTDAYYELYWTAYVLTYPAALFLLLAFGGQAFRFWVALVIPSLVVRHAQFLWQLGPTNTWPPALVIDILLTLPILFTCWGAVRLRRFTMERMRPTG